MFHEVKINCRDTAVWLPPELIHQMGDILRSQKVKLTLQHKKELVLSYYVKICEDM